MVGFIDIELIQRILNQITKPKIYPNRIQITVLQISVNLDRNPTKAHKLAIFDLIVSLKVHFGLVFFPKVNKIPHLINEQSQNSSIKNLEAKQTPLQACVNLIDVFQIESQQYSIKQLPRMGCENSNMLNINALTNQSSNSFKISIENTSSSSSPLKPTSNQFSGRQIILINTAIENHILFYKLDQDQRMSLISSMQKFQVPHSTYIFKVNDEPDYAFILNSGTVRIQLAKDGRQIKKILKEGSVFGDLALINVAKRSASAYAETNCSLIALTKQKFQSKMEELANGYHHILYNFIDRASAFKKLTHSQKKSLSSHMNEVRFQKDAIIFQQGDFANCIYFIKTGEVQILIPKKPPVVLKQGDIFGQGSLKSNSVRKGQAKAISNAHCFVISRNKLELCVEAEDITDITFHCIIRWALKRTAKFAKSQKAMIEKIIESGEISIVEDGDIIAAAGEQLTKLMICLQGEVVLEDLCKTLSSENEEILGVGAIFNEDFSAPIRCPFTITKRQKGSLFTIDHRVLIRLFNPHLPRMSISLKLPQIQYELKDFQLVKKLESTLLTQKYLIMDRRTKINYVMHAFCKSQIIEFKREKLLLNDKELNQSLKHRFVINLVKTFKDQYYVYFIYREYLNFNLDDLIKRLTLPNQETIDFIIMTLINLLEFLHNQHILFRNLKAQSIILDKNGYPNFLSLMLAKKISKLNFKTYTIIGTPHYLAPEVQQGLGYSFPSDYWSLGIIIYQLVIGYFPFADDKEDPYQIFMAIQKQKLTFPKSFTNKPLKKFIKLLLSKQSWNRPDNTNIKACSYFNEIPTERWKQLKQGSFKCPTEMKKLISDFTSEQTTENLNETQGNLLALFERQKSRQDHRASPTFDTSWDQGF